MQDRLSTTLQRSRWVCAFYFKATLFNGMSFHKQRKWSKQLMVYYHPKMLPGRGKHTTIQTALSACSELGTVLRPGKSKVPALQDQAQAQGVSQEKWIIQGWSLWYGMHQGQVLITKTSSLLTVGTSSSPTPTAPHPPHFSPGLPFWIYKESAMCRTLCTDRPDIPTRPLASLDSLS